MRDRMSRNCRDATATDEPLSTHVCTGGLCPCECHHVPPPAPLREMVKAAKAGER